MRCNISELIGKELVAVEGLDTESDEVVFRCEDGSAFRMLHNQNCCESVCIDDIVGDVADLIDGTVLDAREESNDEAPRSGYDESWTWTFYIIQTDKGAVTIKWYGTSNGYYSESVDFERLAP